MFDKLAQIPALQAAKQQLEALPTRDRQALTVLSVVLFLVVIYFAAWVPAKNFMDDKQADLQASYDLLALVETNKKVLRALGRGATAEKPKLDGQQLVAAVTNLARQQGVALKRFEPSGDDSVKVWVEKVSFDKTVRWLTQLEKTQGVEVKQIAMEADEAPGVVTARLTLGS